MGRLTTMRSSLSDTSGGIKMHAHKCYSEDITYPLELDD